MNDRKFTKRLALILLCGSAWFNYEFTHAVLFPYLSYGAYVVALFVAAVNISAFYVDVNMISAAKDGKKLTAIGWLIIRAIFIYYSLLSASSVLNTLQNEALNTHAIAELKATRINNNTDLAELTKQQQLTRLRSESGGAIYNTKGQQVAFKHCKEGSYYSNQEACRNYLDSLSNANLDATFIRTKDANLQQIIELKESLPMVMKPIGGVSVETIFKIIAFLLEAGALALVAYSEYYCDLKPRKTPPFPPASVQKGVIPASVQPKTGELLGTNGAAAKSLDKNSDVTDSQLADLIIGLWQENKDSPLSVNKLNGIIKEQIGYNINKARLIDVMNDSDYIVDKLINGKKAYYLAGDKIEPKRHTSTIQSSEDDGRNKGAETIRSRLSE